MTLIRFPGGPDADAKDHFPTRVEFPETPRQRAGRKRNPLRHHADRVTLAVILAGKLANRCTDQLQGWGDYVAMLRRGADAARFLAEALDSVAREEEVTNEVPAPIA